MELSWFHRLIYTATYQLLTFYDSYCVQMVSVLDVSQPLYGQLLQVQNLDNSNSSVSAETQPTQKVTDFEDFLRPLLLTCNAIMHRCSSDGKASRRECS